MIDNKHQKLICITITATIIIFLLFLNHSKNYKYVMEGFKDDKKKCPESSKGLFDSIDWSQLLGCSECKPKNECSVDGSNSEWCKCIFEEDRNSGDINTDKSCNKSDSLCRGDCKINGRKRIKSCIKESKDKCGDARKKETKNKKNPSSCKKNTCDKECSCKEEKLTSDQIKSLKKLLDRLECEL